MKKVLFVGVLLAAAVFVISRLRRRALGVQPVEPVAPVTTQADPAGAGGGVGGTSGSGPMGSGPYAGGGKGGGGGGKCCGPGVSAPCTRCSSHSAPYSSGTGTRPGGTLVTTSATSTGAAPIPGSLGGVSAGKGAINVSVTGLSTGGRLGGSGTSAFAGTGMGGRF
jgi:hypothetical protein